MNKSKIEKFLSDNEIEYSILEKKEFWKLQQQWREVYSIEVKRKKDTWVYRGYNWHSFSYNFTDHIHGIKALEKYNNKKDKEFIILSEDNDKQGFVCKSEELPDLSSLGDDFYVFPDSYDWTMVFTHEQCAGIGPFYSEKNKNIL